MVKLINENTLNDIDIAINDLNRAIQCKCYKLCYQHKNLSKHDFFELQLLNNRVKEKLKKGVY